LLHQTKKDVDGRDKMLSLVSKDGATGKNSGSDHRRDFFQPDQAGERAHFALLVLTQLEQ
jgi:hypothetical protein